MRRLRETISRQPLGRGQAALELLGALYPPPLDVVIGAGGRSPTRAAYLAVPSARSPHLLVTTRSSRAAVRSLRRQLVGQRLRTRAARLAMSAAIGTGLPARLSPLRIAVTGPQDSASIEDPLAAVLGTPDLCLTLPIGPARATRKPVLQVCGVDGAVLAYAKVGHNELTRQLVRHESEALTRLSKAELAGILVPEVLAAVDWQQLTIVVLAPLDIATTRLRGEDGRRRLLAVVREIAAIGAGPAVPWSAHPHRSRLEEGARHASGSAGRIQEQLARLRPDACVTTAAWHGDLNPGNVALVAGRCPVWDWERFGEQVPLGFDLLHHDLHRAISVVGRDPLDAAQSLLAGSRETLVPLGVDPEACDLTARSYLLTLAERYLDDQQGDAGASLGRVDEWLLPALERPRADPEPGR